MKVLIVDDHKLFADAIVPMLRHRGMEVLDVAVTAQDALTRAIQESPDLVLMDLNLPDGHGLDVGALILAQRPETKIVAVTGMTDGKLANRALRNGFHGFLTKNTPMAEFLGALDVALQGHVVVPRNLAKAAAGNQSPEHQSAHLLEEHLTDREREILSMLVEGVTGEVVAERLSISRNTVRTHIQNLLVKLQVHSRLEAAAFAVKFGIVKSPN